MVNLKKMLKNSKKNRAIILNCIADFGALSFNIDNLINSNVSDGDHPPAPGVAGLSVRQ